MTLEERAKLIADFYGSDHYAFALKQLQEACNETISRCRGYPSDGEMR